MHVGLVQDYAFPGQTIQDGCVHLWVTPPDVAPPEIVGNDQDDVRSPVVPAPPVRTPTRRSGDQNQQKQVERSTEGHSGNVRPFSQVLQFRSLS